MKRQLTFEFFDTKEAALDFEKKQPRHLRGTVTPWVSHKAYETGRFDYNNPEKWIAWYKR